MISFTLSNNQLARTNAIFTALRVGGNDVRVRTVEPGEVWGPLRDTELSAASAVVTEAELLELARDWADAIFAMKPLPESLGVAYRIAKATGTPIIADVDDPDIEARTVWPAYRAPLRAGRHPRRFYTLRRMRRIARRLPSTVSNPVLQGIYGGVVIPHPRPDMGMGAPHVTDRPTMAFVGTVRDHKGIGLLREAVAELAPKGWRLVVTADPPADAQPWEEWTGVVSQQRAFDIVHAADVIALPSEARDYGPGQLPLKLIDAMLAGRGVAVSRLGPLPWAIGDAGVLFEASSLPSLVEALGKLQDPVARGRLGDRARAHALANYTVDVLAEPLNDVLAAATKNKTA